MAFNFGNTTASTPAFSGASGPGLINTNSFAFATTPAASAPANNPFGATPTFGQSSAGFSFASPAPAFGATSAPAFGAASTPAFGASSTPAFGASSTPAFGAAPASSPSPFSFATPGASSAGFSFSTSAPATTPSFAWAGAAGSAPAGTALQLPGAFGTAPPFGFSGQQQQQQQQPVLLTTKDNKPLTHYTKWEDLSEQTQNFLLHLERIISQARQDCNALERCERLREVKPHTERLQQESKQLKQSLQALNNLIAADDAAATAFRENVIQLLLYTDTAVRIFKRDYHWREVSKAGPAHVLTPAIVSETLAGPVVLPSQFLRDIVSQFSSTVNSYRKAVQELEQVMDQSDFHGLAGVKGDKPVEALSASLTNMHDYFMHVAAKVEASHNKVEAAKEAFLARRRQAGDMTDPFAEADRRERLKRDSQALGSGGQRGNGINPPAASGAPPPAGGPTPSLQNLLTLPPSTTAAPTGAAGWGSTAAAFGSTPATATAPSFSTAGGGVSFNTSPSPLFNSSPSFSFTPAPQAGGFGTPFGTTSASTLSRTTSRKGSKSKK